MVFLVEDFVNLPRDQIANIWIAAHMKKKLNKKDIKKTKLDEVCEQLHSDKTKKPMQLRHYGQCLVGISYIHLKQVEYLHTDCNEAFSKARLVLVRKRKVDLDPSKHKRPDITLPDRNNNNNDDNNIDIDINADNNNEMEEDELVIDLNINSSQLYLEDNPSEVGSLFRGSGSNSGDGRDQLALDHEITMQAADLNISPTRVNDRRSSFGGISSLDMGDMDIELRFDDNDDNQNDNEILDESQAKRANIQQLDSLTDVDDDDENKSVEQGRGVRNNNTTIIQDDNISVEPSIDDDNNLINDESSHVSLQKEKEINLDDLGSVHSGSVDNGAIIMHHEMDIDDQSVDDQQSLHVQFDLDAQSVTGSVATADLQQQQQQQQSQIENEEATPPPSPRANDTRVSNKNKKSNKDTKNKLKRKKKKKNKKKFMMDKEIEIGSDRLREKNPDNFQFVYEGGRDSIHIWREFPLSTLEFDNLLYQPLAKQDYGRYTKDIRDKFKDCNSKKVIEKPANKQVLGDTDIDELADPNILRQSGDDAEQGRDDEFDQDLQDLPLPENDFIIDNNNDLDESMNNDQHSAIDEVDLHLSVDDNESALDSVINDNISAEAFDKNISNLGEEQISVEDDDDDDDDDDNDDEEDIDMHDSNHLSFDTGDEDKLTQTNNNNNNNGVKLREWSKRAQKTFSFFESKKDTQFSFDELMKSQTKRDTVVGIFYELLVFKNHDLVDLQQDKPYGDIIISKTNNFYRHARKSRKISKRISEIQASQQQLSAARD